MDLVTILTKIANNEPLTPQERMFFLDFFASLQRQPVNRLSDITFNSGDITAGRFISPSPTSKSTEPTDTTFTGSFMSGIGEAFSDGTYNTGGVSAGVLQWGAKQTDGQFYAGGGNVVINAQGIAMANSATSWFNFKDDAGNIGTINIAADPNNDLEFTNLAVTPAGTISFFLKDTAGDVHRAMKIFEDPANANVVQVDIPLGTGAGTYGSKITQGGTNVLWAAKDGTETVFNDSSYDIDFRIEGATDTNLLKIDAGLDAAAFGGAPDGAYKLKVYGDMIVTGEFSATTLDTIPADGWIEKSATWTRTGNHTFTLVGDQTTVYRKGTKVRYKDGGSFEYGVIASSVFGSVTTVTLITNSDYAMAAATITDTAISYIENPEAFPHWFNWDPAPAGFSAVPSSPKYKWTTYGRTISIPYAEGNNGTSNQTFFTATAPVAPIIDYSTPLGTTVDNTVVKTTSGRMVLAAGSTTITFRSDSASGAWTNSGGKRAIGIAVYEF